MRFAKWYLSTWVWGFILAPVIVVLVALGVPFWWAVGLCAAVFLVLRPFPRRRR
jgi:hypothetical protein